MKKAKILILTKDKTIDKVRKQILDIVNTDTFTVVKNTKDSLYLEDALTITEIRQYGQSCRGCRANLIALDGDFTDEELEIIYPMSIDYITGKEQHILPFNEFIKAYEIYYRA